MLLVVHTLTGAAIGQAIGQPWLAGAISFASHFVLDMIPHGDEHILACPDRCHTQIKKYLPIIKVDAIASVAVFIFIASNPSIFSLSVLVSIICSVLPDILSGLYELGHWKKWQKMYFPRFWRLHRFIHNHIIRWDPGMSLGFLIQGGFFVLLLRLLKA